MVQGNRKGDALSTSLLIMSDWRQSYMLEGWWDDTSVALRDMWCSWRGGGGEKKRLQHLKWS